MTAEDAKDYTLVRAESLSDLELNVRKHIALGWVPFEAPVWIRDVAGPRFSTVLVQAMIRTWVSGDRVIAHEEEMVRKAREAR